jgi:hypothetical protein
MGSWGMRISMLLAIKHTPSYTHADLPVRIVECIRSTIAHTLLYRLSPARADTGQYQNKNKKNLNEVAAYFS